MLVHVNGKPVHLPPGTTVRHALLHEALLEDILRNRRKVLDEWGNEVGLDGALSEGMKLSIPGIAGSPPEGEAG